MGGSKKATFLKESMNQNWNFQRDGRFRPKPLCRLGYRYFLEHKNCSHIVGTNSVLEINIAVKVTFFIPL